MPLSVGTRPGAHEILAPIGAGGMAEVYHARDTKLGREVAIKVVLQANAADPESLGRLEREARALAALNHPSIATLLGFEQQAGQHFLVMEYVAGRSLADVITSGLPLPDALAIARQTGHIVYGSAGALRAVAFDLGTLAWVDRAGKVSTVAAEPRNYRGASLSPDGRQAAVVIEEQGSSAVWICDFARESLTRLTPPSLTVGFLAPLWSADGRELFFWGTSVGAAEAGVFRMAASGVRSPEKLTRSAARQLPSSWTPDGKQILLTSKAGGGLDVQLLTLGPTPEVSPLVVAPGFASRRALTRSAARKPDPAARRGRRGRARR
jgi:hypothetical protein